MEKNVMEMTGIEALEAQVNARRDRNSEAERRGGKSSLLKKKFSRPKLGTYEAILADYREWTSNNGEDRIVLQLELLDRATGEIFKHSDFKNETGLEYLQNSMELWFDREFADIEEMLEYMTSTRFYIELVENEVDGASYTNVKYLTRIA